MPFCLKLSEDTWADESKRSTEHAGPFPPGSSYGKSGKRGFFMAKVRVEHVFKAKVHTSCPLPYPLLLLPEMQLS